MEPKGFKATNPVVEDYYRQLYESSGYECRAAFDPDLEWTEDEEKALRRKLMYRVTLTSAILFFGLQVDRSNLSQAVSDNLLEDLGLTTNDYNLGNTLFLISFLIAEIPSQLISKAVGPTCLSHSKWCAGASWLCVKRQ
ncbi:hypothetical protein OXX59_008078 [Metschnikowia pulcherrima]